MQIHTDAILSSAKRYERLMKAHGITGNNGAAKAGSAGPSEPSTPVNQGKTKTKGGSRPSTNKKRKLAARGDDLDEEVKAELNEEIKTEVKEESAAFDTDGSYMMHPSNPSEAATCTPVLSSERLKNEHPYGDEDILWVSETQREYGGPAAPMAFVQQMLMPPPPDGFYGFIDPSSDMHLLSPTSHPFAHGNDADYPPQTMAPSDPAVGHWLQHHQHNSFF